MQSTIRTLASEMTFEAERNDWLEVDGNDGFIVISIGEQEGDAVRIKIPLTIIECRMRPQSRTLGAWIDEWVRIARIPDG